MRQRQVRKGGSQPDGLPWHPEQKNEVVARPQGQRNAHPSPEVREESHEGTHALRIGPDAALRSVYLVVFNSSPMDITRTTAGKRQNPGQYMVVRPTK